MYLPLFCLNCHTKVIFVFVTEKAKETKSTVAVVFPFKWGEEQIIRNVEEWKPDNLFAWLDCKNKRRQFRTSEWIMLNRKDDLASKGMVPDDATEFGLL